MGKKEEREVGGKRANSLTLTDGCPGFQSTGLHHHRLDVEVPTERSTTAS